MLSENEKKKFLSEIIKLFVVKEKQNRFMGFMDSSKRYDDFLNELLNDPRNLKSECLLEIPSGNHAPENILKHLKNLGAGTKAYVVSLIWDSDGAVGDLNDVIFAETGHNAGTIIYCIGSSLAYYEDSENFRFILKSKSII